MKRFVFILFLFTSLGFSETEENELKIMESDANSYVIDDFMKNINNKEFMLKAIGLNNYALQNVALVSPEHSSCLTP